jgi:hypothetical protein
MISEVKAPKKFIIRSKISKYDFGWGWFVCRYNHKRTTSPQTRFSKFLAHESCFFENLSRIIYLTIDWKEAEKIEKIF